MVVVIAGSSGFLGTALRGALTARGDRVVRLVRPVSPAGGETIAWEPSSGRIDAGAFEGVDAVVNLAGVSIGGGRGTPKRLRKLRDSRIDSTRLLASTVGAMQRPPAVFLSQSAIGYYGERGEDLIEEAEPPGRDVLAQLTADWEAACDDARSAGVRVVNTRTGLVLDPSGGLLQKMLIPFRLGLGTRLGNGRQWMSWVSLQDAIAAMLFVLDNDVAGPVNVAAPEPVRNADFTRVLASVLHRPAFLAVPQQVLDIALGSELGPALTQSLRVVPARLQELGFRFGQTDLERTLRDLLDGKAA